MRKGEKMKKQYYMHNGRNSEDYIRGNGTAIDAFESDYGLNVLTIRVECPKCGHIWGIKVDEFNDNMDIPERRFICMECFGK
jgi:hypothetical protein